MLLIILGTLAAITFIFLMWLKWKKGNKNYNVAVVSVRGVISRNKNIGTRKLTADQIVSMIQRADNDEKVEALLLKINSPGGAVVPSEDIGIAVENFDGPTIGHSRDLCASGGYLIACYCDEIHARESAMVGSIGVIASRTNWSDLAENYGIEYERYVGGSHKDTTHPLKKTEEEQRKHIQSLVNESYHRFVQLVSDKRKMDYKKVKDTEAKIFRGKGAYSKGLVDELGTLEEAKDTLSDRLDKEVKTKKLHPQINIFDKLANLTANIAYECGRGIGNSIVKIKNDHLPDIRM